MFFQTINQMITAGTDLSINIRQMNNNLTVSVMPRRSALKNEAGGHIVPLVLNGTPEELDMGFLQAISTPIQKAQGILTNLETFEKQAEQAASQGKAAKAAVEKESKEVREKREKMEKLLKKAEDATTGKRYSEALTWLKQAKVLATADKQKEIDAKMAEVQKKASEGNLFGTEPAMTELRQEPAPQLAENHTPQYQGGEQMQMFAPGQPDRRPQPIPHRQEQQPLQPIQAASPAQPVQYAQPVPQTPYGVNGAPIDYPYSEQQVQMPAGQYIQPSQPMQQPMQQPVAQPIQFHRPVQMPQPQMHGEQWRQPIPPQPEDIPVQPLNGNNGAREYRSQPQGVDTYSFDKDDECDRELLREDPYAEYLDFPEEYRMKDEAQMETICC